VLVRVQELVPGWEPGQELASVLVLELGQVPGLEPEPALELGQVPGLGLGLHRQPVGMKPPSPKQSKH